MEDKINPNHYKGLKGLYIKVPSDDGVLSYKCEPAQVIDIIESTTRFLYGGFATNLGNVIKYLLRFNLKGHDSYQNSQFEKNYEELKKVAWYSKRFSYLARHQYITDQNRVNGFYLNTIYNSEDGKHTCSLFDVYDACVSQYPECCHESLLRVFIDIDKIVSYVDILEWIKKLEQDTSCLIKAYESCKKETITDENNK